MFFIVCVDNNEFLKDTEDYIKECIKYYEYKEKQRPINSLYKRHKCEYHKGSNTWLNVTLIYNMYLDQIEVIPS